MDQEVKEVKNGIGKGKIIVLSVLMILLIAGITYLFSGGTSQTNTVKNTVVNTFFSKEKINLLVLGVDTRDDDVGRSDTTFVVTIDTVKKTMTTLSIPRDSRVKIDGHGWDKINHAYAFGGPTLSKSSVEALIGVPIDYTVIMSLQGFTGMIDAIGGITIDVDKKMYYSDPYDDNGGLYIDLQPGIQDLNGRTAIEYVRYRDEEGDIGRVTRQQKFLKSLLQKFANTQMIAKLPALIEQFAIAVKTDMPVKEMIKLIPIINDVAKSGLRTEWVSGTPCWIQDVSYWLPDIKELREKIAQIQGIAVDVHYEQITEKLANEYALSVPREMNVTEPSPRSSSQRYQDIDQHTVDTPKKIVPTADATKNTKLASNKSDSDSLSVNGKNTSASSSDKPIAQKTTSPSDQPMSQRNDDVVGDSTKGVNKTVLADKKDKKDK